MKKLMLALLFVGSLAAHANDVCIRGDALPWPWGTECPFPWSEIEGDWKAKDHFADDTFRINVLSIDRLGGRTFEIKRFNANNELVAQGKGVASKRRKIIRAALHSVGEEKQKNYWALVRAYNEQDGFTCNIDQIAIVVTLRTTRPKTCEPDKHYIIKRALPNETIGDH